MPSRPPLLTVAQWRVTRASPLPKCPWRSERLPQQHPRFPHQGRIIRSWAYSERSQRRILCPLHKQAHAIQFNRGFFRTRYNLLRSIFRKEC